MGRVRIVWGAGTGPTALASYDAALAAANVQDYNLLRVSSVLPVGTTVSIAGTAPDLGPIGGRLTVVEAQETSVRTGSDPERFDDSPSRVDGSGPDRDDPSGREHAADDRNGSGAVGTEGEGSETDREEVSVGLGWAQATNGRGIVYEATGVDPLCVRARIDAGLRAGATLREFVPATIDRVVLSTDGSEEWLETDGDTYTDGDSKQDSPSSKSTRCVSVDADRSVLPTGRYEDDDPSREANTDRAGEPYVTAIVLAVYGESEPIFGGPPPG